MGSGSLTDKDLLKGYELVSANDPCRDCQRIVALEAESTRLLTWLQYCCTHSGQCNDCPAVIRGPIGGCKAQEAAEDFAPLTAALADKGGGDASA